MKGAQPQCATQALEVSLDCGEHLVEEEQTIYSDVETHHPMMELPRYVSDALFVTDLHPSAEEYAASLHEVFSQIGTVASIRVKRPADAAGKPPLCNAYVNFLALEDACRAWQTLNYHVWMGMPMRIMFSNLDPATRYNEKANIIVMNLAESIDSEALHITFCIFGVVLSCKVELDLSGKSTGRGFIQFQDEEAADRAIEMVNNKMLENKVVSVGRFIRRTFAPQLQDHMSGNAIDLDPTHGMNQPHFKADIPSPCLRVVENRPHDIQARQAGAETGFQDIHQALESVAVIGSPDTTIASGSTSNSISVTERGEEGESVSSVRKASRDIMLRRWSRAERNMAKRRAKMERKLNDILRVEEEICEDSKVDKLDSAHLPSSVPWPPQPWSVAILQEMLGKAHVPQERRAMLGATLLPLVAKHTNELATDITNEMVKLGLEKVVTAMRLSEEALQETVDEVKLDIMRRIKAQAPFIPATTQVSLPPPAIAIDEKPVAANEPTMALVPLPPRRLAPECPDSILRYTYRPGLGTGFFEPLHSARTSMFFE